MHNELENLGVRGANGYTDEILAFTVIPVESLFIKTFLSLFKVYVTFFRKTFSRWYGPFYSSYCI